MLMDVHGQHEHQFLMDPRYHLRFLDASGDDEHQALLGRVADAYQAFIAKHRQYAHLVKENERKQYRMEQLKQGLAELSKARLKEGEEEALIRERDQSRAFEKIHVSLQNAYEQISGTENKPALVRLKSAVDSLVSLRELG